MKTRRFTPGWTLTIIVAAMLGMVAWYGVMRWLEPKPLWVRSYTQEQRHFQPTNYEPDRKLLVGYEFNYDRSNPKMASDTSILILDAGSGTTVAQLHVGDLRFQGINQHLLHSHPHIAGDRIYRFALRVENEQEIVELRSWAFATEQQERIEHTWHIDLDNWHAEWNQHDHRRFHIERRWTRLPAFFPLVDPTMGVSQTLTLIGQQLMDARPLIFESWTAEPIARALCSWVQPEYGSRWTSSAEPGKMFYSDAERGMVFVTDTNTGTTQPLSYVNRENKIGVLHASDHLLALRSIEKLVINNTPGGPERTWLTTPSPASEVNWSLDDWRPFYDLRTGTQLAWPKELNTSILGQDHLVVDHQDSSRLLYYSEVNHPAQQTSEYLFQLMTLQDGQLKLAASWKNDALLNVLQLKFSKQLIATVDEIVLPAGLFQKIPHVPWIQDLVLWFVPEQRRSVALIDEMTGKILWRRPDREILNIAGITERMNRDFLMMMHYSYDKAPLAHVKEYECWALPIVVYSAWWARGTGALVMVLMMVTLQRGRLQAHPDVSTRRSVAQFTFIE